MYKDLTAANLLKVPLTCADLAWWQMPLNPEERTRLRIRHCKGMKHISESEQLEIYKWWVEHNYPSLKETGIRWDCGQNLASRAIAFGIRYNKPNVNI